jgi:hypothetical protein
MYAPAIVVVRKVRTNNAAFTVGIPALATRAVVAGCE